jgi:gamma-glutamyltranspeptidase/glutathione hydrolase
MSPSIITDMDGNLAYLVGSPGGFRIIGYVSRAIMSMIDFGYDPQEAANAPHTQNQNGVTELETPIPGVTSEYDIAALEAALEERGHVVEERGGEESGLSIIQVTEEGIFGGADPRRDGTAVGGAPDPVDPTSSTFGTFSFALLLATTGLMTATMMFAGI